MASLSAHLRNPDTHGGLRFHPACPICRQERLAGTPATGGPVSPRAQAALAISVLALAIAAPAALAAQGDPAQGGAAPVTQADSDPSHSPDTDPGGPSDELPVEPSPTSQPDAPPVDAGGDTGAVDQQPATDTDDSAVDGGDGSDDQTGQPPQASDQAGQPSQAGDQTGSGQVPTPTPAQQPTATPMAPIPSPATTPSSSETEATSTGRAARRPHRQGRHRPRIAARRPVHDLQPTVAPAPTSPAPPARTSAPKTASLASAPAVAQPSRAATIRAAGRATPGEGTHTVHAGESLWSIAGDLLGPGASPARIAREVNRLWQRNRERIATGDPDLLKIGTTLRLG